MKLTRSGYIVETTQDYNAENPREIFDTTSTIATVSNRYYRGDQTLSYEEIEEITQDPSKLYANLYIYVHSGISIKTAPFGCRFDSGHLGIIYCDKSEDEAENVQRIDMMNKEIELLDKFVSGSVYEYTIKDSDGEIVDSCCGIYGWEEAEAAALEALANLEKEDEKNVLFKNSDVKKIKSMIRKINEGTCSLSEVASFSGEISRILMTSRVIENE